MSVEFIYFDNIAEILLKLVHEKADLSFHTNHMVQLWSRPGFSPRGFVKLGPEPHWVLGA